MDDTVLKPCKICGEASPTKYCRECGNPIPSNEKANRRFYNSKRWKRARQAALARDVFACVRCKRKGIEREAKCVDHIIPIEAGGDRIAITNLQSLCTPCHSEKTAEDVKRLGNVYPLSKLKRMPGRKDDGKTEA